MEKYANANSGSWLRRLAWLVIFWVCSVAALGAAAWLLKMIMRAAGMH